MRDMMNKYQVAGFRKALLTRYASGIVVLVLVGRKRLQIGLDWA